MTSRGFNLRESGCLRPLLCRQDSDASSENSVLVSYSSRGELRHIAAPGLGAAPAFGSAALACPTGATSADDDDVNLGALVTLASSLGAWGGPVDDSLLLRRCCFVVAEEFDGALLLEPVCGGEQVLCRRSRLRSLPERSVVAPEVVWDAPAGDDCEGEPFEACGLLWAVRVSVHRAAPAGEALSAGPPTVGGGGGAAATAAAGGAMSTDADAALAMSMQLEQHADVLRGILGDAFNESMLKGGACDAMLLEILVGAGVLPPAATSAEAQPTAADRAAALSGASSVEDVGKWLAGEGVAPDVVGNFERERVDGAALQRLSAADLARMGITKLGPKKALLQKIRDLAAGAGGGQTERYAGARCGCATCACGLRSSTVGCCVFVCICCVCRVVSCACVRTRACVLVCVRACVRARACVRVRVVGHGRLMYGEW